MLQTQTGCVVHLMLIGILLQICSWQQVKCDKICAIASLAMPVIARDADIWITSLVANKVACSKLMAILERDVKKQIQDLQLNAAHQANQVSQESDIAAVIPEIRQLSTDELKQLKSSLRGDMVTSILQFWRSEHLECLLKKLSPKERGQADQLRKELCKGNIKYAYRIAGESLSQNVRQVFNYYMYAFFSHFNNDPFAKKLKHGLPWGPLKSSYGLEEEFDCIVLRNMIYEALCEAWNVTEDSPKAIKKAVFSLCNVTSKGKLRCSSELINQQVLKVIDNACYQDQQMLISFFYLPNGVLRDIKDHNMIEDLVMPVAILDTDRGQERKLLNDLVIAHVYSTTKAEQDLIMRAITNMKYALSYPLSNLMKQVFLKNVKLVCKSLKHGMHEVAHKFVIEAEHFKGLETIEQFAAQTEVCSVQNILFDVWIDAISQSQSEPTTYCFNGLEGIGHAQALVKEGLPEHGLQLAYKILLTDRSKFKERLPKFTTTAQEQESNWVVRDIQGNVIVISSEPTMDSVTADAHRYMRNVMRKCQPPKEKPLDVEQAIDNSIDRAILKCEQEVRWRNIGTNAYKEFIKLPISSSSHLATMCAALIVSGYCIKKLRADFKQNEMQKKPQNTHYK